MGSEAKPYTLEELFPGGREVPGLYGADRLRATVEALATALKERDEARVPMVLVDGDSEFYRLSEATGEKVAEVLSAVQARAEKAEAALASLKHHAEAMARALRLIERRSLDYLRTENRSPYGSTGYGELADQAHDALSSYRKDYPEGT